MDCDEDLKDMPMDDDQSDGDTASESGGQGRGRRGNKGQDWVPAKQTKRYKDSHKATEKCRRDKINQSIKALAEMVPACCSRLSKPDKLTVLSQTVDYIKGLKTLQQQMEHRGGEANGKSSMGRPPNAPETDWRQLVISNIDDVLHVFNLQGQIIHTSPSWKSVLGLAPSTAVGQNISDLIHPHDIDYVKWHINKYHSTGVDFVARYRKESGDYMWLGVRGRPYWSNDSTCYIIAVGRPYNLTKVMSVTDQTDEASEFSSKHNLNTSWTYVSPEVHVLLGYQPDDLLGTFPKDICHPDENSTLVDPSTEYNNGEQQLRMSYRCKTKAGDYVWLETTAWQFLNPITKRPEFIFCKTKRADTCEFSRVLEPYNNAASHPDDQASVKGLISGLVQLRNENMELRQQIMQVNERFKTAGGVASGAPPAGWEDPAGRGFVGQRKKSDANSAYSESYPPTPNFQMQQQQPPPPRRDSMPHTGHHAPHPHGTPSLNHGHPHHDGSRRSSYVDGEQRDGPPPVMDGGPWRGYGEGPDVKPRISELMAQREGDGRYDGPPPMPYGPPPGPGPAWREQLAAATAGQPHVHGCMGHPGCTCGQPHPAKDGSPSRQWPGYDRSMPPHEHCHGPNCTSCHGPADPHKYPPAPPGPPGPPPGDGRRPNGTFASSPSSLGSGGPASMRMLRPDMPNPHRPPSPAFSSSSLDRMGYDQWKQRRMDDQQQSGPFPDPYRQPAGASPRPPSEVGHFPPQRNGPGPQQGME